MPDNEDLPTSDDDAEGHRFIPMADGDAADDTEGHFRAKFLGDDADPSRPDFAPLKVNEDAQDDTEGHFRAAWFGGDANAASDAPQTRPDERMSFSGSDDDTEGHVYKSGDEHIGE